MDQIDLFNAAYGAMLLGLSLFVLATAFAIFRSPGKRLKSLRFDRDEDGSWIFQMTARKQEEHGAFRRYLTTHYGHAEAQDASPEKALDEKKANP